jgi:hypothetical protein
MDSEKVMTQATQDATQRLTEADLPAAQEEEEEEDPRCPGAPVTEKSTGGDTRKIVKVRYQEVWRTDWRRASTFPNGP